MKILAVVLVLIICLPEAGAQMPTDAVVLEDLDRDELTRDVTSETPSEAAKPTADPAPPSKPGDDERG